MAERHAGVERRARGTGVVAALADGVGRVGARGAAVEGVIVCRDEARGGEDEESEELHFDGLVGSVGSVGVVVLYIVNIW